MFATEMPLTLIILRLVMSESPEEIKIQPNSFNQSVVEKLEYRGHSINNKRSPVFVKVVAILLLTDRTSEACTDSRHDHIGVWFYHLNLQAILTFFYI